MPANPPGDLNPGLAALSVAAAAARLGTRRMLTFDQRHFGLSGRSKAARSACWPAIVEHGARSSNVRHDHERAANRALCKPPGSPS
jgi:hypothetical protein